MHGIPILRIWESDIRKHPKEVLEMLEKTFKTRKEYIRLDENKKKRH